MKNILRITFSLFFIIFAGYGYSLGEGASEEEELITIYKGEVKPEALRSIRETAAKGESRFKVSYSQTKISPVSEYVRKVSQQIRRNFVYPWAAKEANLEGSLKLILRVYYTGQLLGVEIKESSGYAVLDENAVSIVKKVAPYPAFPVEMKQKELWIDLPIVYKTK